MDPAQGAVRVSAIELRDGRASFRPGERVRGTIVGDIDPDLGNVELRLSWWTEGKGTSDAGTVAVQPLAATLADRAFELELPAFPYSYSGKLVSILWVLELVAGRQSLARVEIVVGPQGQELTSSAAGLQPPEAKEG